MSLTGAKCLQVRRRQASVLYGTSQQKAYLQRPSILTQSTKSVFPDLISQIYRERDSLTDVNWRAGN